MCETKESWKLGFYCLSSAASGLRWRGLYVSSQRDSCNFNLRFKHRVYYSLNGGITSVYVLFLLLLLMPAYCAAEDILSLRAGYFRFANGTARNIYGDGTLDLELENVYRFTPVYALWVNGNGSSKSGHSEVVHDKTRLYLFTLSLGPKFFFPIYRPYIDVYVGAGISGAYVHVKDDTDELPSSTTRGSLGCVGKLGLWIVPDRRIVLDLFLDYYYQPVRTRQSSSLRQKYLDLGGLRCGLGVGYRF